jgi:hypothetical protein
VCMWERCKGGGGGGGGELENSGAVYQVFRDCMKVSVSVKREMLCDILICSGLVKRMQNKITM